MTNEADNTNLAMSLLDDSAEAAFYASINKVKSQQHQCNSEQERRMNGGQWSNQDKQEWNCQTCTFLNQPLYLSCEMCGQARPEEAEESASTAQQVASVLEHPSAADVLSATRQADLLAEEEERLLKQQRIKEIMALQQGIFNKIQEGNEEQELESLEGSFAWMELDGKELAMSSHQSPRNSGVAVGGKGGKDVKKLAMMDASSNTVSTAAMSSFDGSSSRYSLDFSANSQHSRLSATRNSAIPDQALASLKEESSFNHNSFSGHQSFSGATRKHSAPATYVDFNALKASVEGASVRSISMDNVSSMSQSIPERVQVESNHSRRSLLGSSNHSSLGMEESVGSQDHARRRGPLMTSSLRSMSILEDEAEKRPSLVDANSIKGFASSSKSVDYRRSQLQRNQHNQLSGDLPDLSPPPLASRAPKEMMVGEEFAVDPTPPSGSTPRASLFSRARKNESNDINNNDLDRRGSLHRPDGARRMTAPSMIPAERKSSLATPRDSVFSRNLYADRKQEAAAKNKNKQRSSVLGKGVGIPILGGMLRKKTPKSDS